MKTLFLSILLVVFSTAAYADTVFDVYQKAQEGDYVDDFMKSLETYGGEITKEKTKKEIERIEQVKPGETFEDTDGDEYLRRCGYAGTNCTWEKIN